jgi:DNA-binding phage protein
MSWVELFKHASMVISGTFHGTVFGLKYNKKVIACPSMKFINRKEKIRSFLNDIGAMACYLDLQAIDSPELLQHNLNAEWGSQHIMAAIDEKVKVSRLFLYRSLSAEAAE